MNKFRVVKCRRVYWAFVLNLINLSKDNLFYKRCMGSSEFYSSLRGRSRLFKVVLLDNRAVGFYSVEDGEISIVVHPSYRGFGVGNFIVGYILKRFKNKRLDARIKVSNRASIRLFEKFGFVRDSINFVRDLK